jgi:hypothetical protein
MERQKSTQICNTISISVETKTLSVLHPDLVLRPWYILYKYWMDIEVEAAGESLSDELLKDKVRQIMSGKMSLDQGQEQFQKDHGKAVRPRVEAF